ncbi:MAG: ABC transporter permease [bacterium]
MQAIFSIFKFQVLNLLRNFKSAGIMFILPIVFMGIFAFAFGSNTTLLNFSVGVYQPKNDISHGAPNLVEVMKKADDNSDSIKIDIKEYSSLEELTKAVNSDTINIGASLELNNLTGKLDSSIVGKQNSTGYIQYKSVLEDILYSITLPESSQLKVLSSTDTSKKTSVFDILVPGLMIYGLLILIPGIAQDFTEITEKNYIFRFRNSKTKSWQIISGTILFYLCLSIIQIILLFLTATVFGYVATGSILLALIPALLSSLFVIGIGLLIGSFVKKTAAATNIGTIVSIIFGFFSGSFISGIGSIARFDILGKTYEFNDLLPSKWGTVAIDKILSKNMGLADISTEMIVLGVTGVIIILVGIYVYDKKQLKVQTNS